MCKAAGLRGKTAHCLCVTFGSSLFNARLDSTLICNRSSHRSDALLMYEKVKEKAIVGLNPYTGKIDFEQEKVVIKEKKVEL